MIRDYYYLTKPGIIRGNLITAAAGFFLASQANVDLGRLVAILGGTSLVIASGCVLNNYLDISLDKQMARTKKRALVTGAVTSKNALVYASLLGLVGEVTLLIFTNLLTALIGLFGLFVYVVIYGVAKRRTVHGTLIGSLAGAVPPVAGYTAVTGRLDWAALTLFLILVFWQMPHFYAIAIYRFDEYRAAGLPMLPIIKGIRATKLQMLNYCLFFMAACQLLTLLNYTNLTYSAVMVIIGCVWLCLAATGFSKKSDVVWAKQMFGTSLLVLLTFSVSLALTSFFG